MNTSRAWLCQFLKIALIGLSLAKGAQCAGFPVHLPLGTPGTDLTESFLEVLGQETPWGDLENLPPEMVRRLPRCQLILVPGFLAGFGEPLFIYFKKEMNFLERHGLVRGDDFIKLSLDRGFSGVGESWQNIPAIVRAIETSTRPVILVSHSKGTVDVLETFATHPEVLPKVAGWISMQGAVLGSPIADAICESRDLGKLSWLLRRLGGNREVLQALRQERRTEFLSRHLEMIRGLSARFPILSFGSVVPQNELSRPLRILNRRYGQWGRGPQAGQPELADRTDGLLPLENTLVPFTDYAVLEGLDHLGHHSRVQVFPALLTLLFAKL